MAGSTTGAKFETYGLALEQKLWTRTYLGLEEQWLISRVDQSIGAVDLLFPPTFVPSSTREELNYREQNLIVTLNQLLGNCWSVGARYQLSRAQLETVFPDIPSSVSSANDTKNDAILHELALLALFNHPSGFYARGEAAWYLQRNAGYQPGLPGDEFCQFNLFGGYRFCHRRAAAEVGVLNLNDRDYQLNPLNLYTELPRRRMLVADLQFDF